MAIHYDPKTKRFRDERGFVSRERAMRSSVARREYEAAQRKKAKPKPKPAPKAKPKPAPKPAPKAKPKPAKKVSHGKPKAKPRPRKPKDADLPPWDREGIVKETPDDDEWFTEFPYDYDDLIDEWGDYDDEETDS